MNYRDFQKTLRAHVSFNLVENTDFLNNVHMYYQPEISKARFRNPWRKLMIGFTGIVLLAMLSLGIVFQFDIKASITLDLNPSLEININRFNRVVSVEALNSDGDEIVDNLRRDSGSLAKVLEEIRYQTIALGYATADNVTMLFGVSAKNYETENMIKAEILECYGDSLTTLLILNKHTEVSTSIFSGYAYLSVADQEGGAEYNATTTATSYITTAAATWPASTTSDYNDYATTIDSSSSNDVNSKWQISDSGVFSEDEFVNFAQTLGITDAKLQVVLKVFFYYPQYVHESDIELLAAMNLSDLLVLYNNIVSSS